MKPPIDTRAREYAWWTVCAAGAVVFALSGGAHTNWLEGTALWVCVVAGRYAARTNERRKAAAQIRHHHAAALRSAANGMLDAAIAHGDHGIHGTLTYGQAATILRDVAAIREKEQP